MFPLFTEVFTGICGALIVSAIALMASVSRDWVVQRRYPVAGQYVTYFEDLIDGQRHMQTAMSRIKQRGHRITGTTTLKNGRKWLLNGSIMGIGHISGIYSAEATDDEGVGSFYLRVNGHKLDGMWSGYDHVNKITTAGRYMFERLANIKIVPLEDRFVPAILAIADHEFGPNYISEADLRSDSKFKILVAIQNKKVVGFAVGGTGSVSETLKNPEE
jgi:hypothetical protein